VALGQTLRAGRHAASASVEARDARHVMMSISLLAPS
jgi:hypothetical protein